MYYILVTSSNLDRLLFLCVCCVITSRANIILETYEHRQKKEHHKYVTDRRNLLAIRSEVDSLVEFVSQRFQADEKLLSVVQPFVAISKAADIVEIHKLLCSEIDLQRL